MNDPVSKHPFRTPNIPPFSQDHLNSQPTSCLTKTHNLGPERIRVHELSHGAHCQGALSDPPGQAWFPCLVFISVTSPTYRALVHLPRTFLIVPPTPAPRAAGSKRASVRVLWTRPHPEDVRPRTYSNYLWMDPSAGSTLSCRYEASPPAIRSHVALCFLL